jgi:hypothetical protein
VPASQKPTATAPNSSMGPFQTDGMPRRRATTTLAAAMTMSRPTTMFVAPAPPPMSPRRR